MLIRQNPWRYNTPPGWNDIRDAPRDGTPIEIQNNWGVAPHFGVCRWDEKWSSWQYVDRPNSGMSDGPHLSWRPYNGNAANYVDPTGGAQDTQAYWLEACGRPDLAIKAGNRKLSDPQPERDGKTESTVSTFDDALLPTIIVVICAALIVVAVLGAIVITQT